MIPRVGSGGGACYQDYQTALKGDVINHIVTRTSSDWQKIENAWPSINIARKADPRMVLKC